jgi:BlaI family transcriptional regulator, penicillinase repressor
MIAFGRFRHGAGPDSHTFLDLLRTTSYNRPMVQAPLPTEAELAFLRVLWDLGPSTVREVHEAVGADRDVGYTTVLKILQIMHEKGLVLRDDSARSHVYRASAPRERTQKRLLNDLVDRAFGGSSASLVLQALSSRRASPDELEAIRTLLSKLEEEEA